MKKKVILIGAGISGLSCLYFFLKKNAQKIQKIEIFEKEAKIGGVLTHTEKDGFIFEHGAQGVLSSRINFVSLLSELDLTQNISRAESKKAHRSFFIKNRIVRISPTNIIQMFRVNLISVFMLVRIISEFFVKAPNRLNQNETVKDFFSRRFGKKFAKNFVGPVMKGIWGGGMARILARFAFPSLQVIEQEHRSILKYFFKNAKSSKEKQKKEMLSFEGGMETLPKKILHAIKTLCEKENIDFKLNLNSFLKKIEQNEFDVLIYSGQPWQEENLFFDSQAIYRQDNVNLSSVDSALGSKEVYSAVRACLEVLKQIPTHTLVVVGIGSSSADIQNRLDGFGALAVENNSEGVLGVISVHSLNPTHVPAGSFLYRVIMGGENMPSVADLKSCNDATIIQLAKQYLQKYKLLDKEKTYDFEHVVRYVNYIPLPTQHQEKVIQAISDLEKYLPGVFFVGNYLMGPAVDACISQANFTAEKMSEYLTPNEK